MLRKIRYIPEAVALAFGLLFFRLLPLDTASAVGGMLARLIGPLSRAHLTASTNLALALPELDRQQQARILSEMWDNFGRVIGEYPHLPTHTMRRRITIEGAEHLDGIKSSDKGALFLSGHFANWEVAPLAASLSGLPLVSIYRAPNNPFTEWVICRIRSRYSSDQYDKGRIGAKQTFKALKAGRRVAMLVDQKMNNGSPIPFFGRAAMTTTAAIQLAIKLGVPVVTVRMIRKNGAHFHVLLQPSRIYDGNTDPIEAMKELNLLFENWIREYPAQWLWVHNRWGKSRG